MDDITIKRLDGSLVEVTGSVVAEKFDNCVARATKQFIAQTEMKGFRKGKAPENLVIQQVGETVILERAAELALNDVWPNVLEQNKGDFEVIGRPEFQITKIARGNPLEWKAQAAILPEVKLPDWRALAKEVMKHESADGATATEKEVEDTLGFLQKSRVKQGETPPLLDDNFAKELGNFDSLDALKQHLKKNITQEKELKIREERRVRILEAIRTKTTMELPPIIIDSEKQKMLHELKSTLTRMGQEWRQYLDRVKKTEDEVLNDFTDEATRRASYGLILKTIANDAKITITPEQITERTDTILSQYGEDERNQIDRARVEEYAYGMLANEQVFTLLEHEK